MDPSITFRINEVDECSISKSVSSLAQPEHLSKLTDRQKKPCTEHPLQSQTVITPQTWEIVNN